ncbi:MAG: class I SAM-dependent methyltransferase [Deltaproteobacteria bacterium]|nr:class I SAM-dependent methyltransferase [Deltaproteobacteria bacterium]
MAASTQAQTLREQRFARTIDREVAPLWHDRFARLILRHLPRGSDAFTLDVHCGPGRSTYELLDRLGEGSRVLALEPDAALRHVAKSRMRPEWKSRVYLKDGALTDVVGMAADTYDLVSANLVLGEVQNFGESLREILRVTKPGGHILATLPLAGTWAEVEDLFREVLRSASQRDAARRLRHLSRLRLNSHDIARSVAGLGVGPHHFVVEQERTSLLFASGREFLFSPVIEHGPLRAWKAILGAHAKPQELFWKLKEAIDTYYADNVFSVSVVLGLLHIRVPERGSAAAHGAAETAGEYWRRFPELDALFQRAERADGEEDIDIDLDLDMDADADADEDVAAAEPEPPPTASSSSMRMSAEDEAIFALLDQPTGTNDDNAELDALLDQVLEFAKPQDEIEELDDALLEEVFPEDKPKRPGETLKRIKSLLPPPPVIPPPPPTRRGRGRGSKG